MIFIDYEFKVCYDRSSATDDFDFKYTGIFSYTKLKLFFIIVKKFVILL